MSDGTIRAMWLSKSPVVDHLPVLKIELVIERYRLGRIPKVATVHIDSSIGQPDDFVLALYACFMKAIAPMSLKLKRRICAAVGRKRRGGRLCDTCVVHGSP